MARKSAADTALNAVDRILDARDAHSLTEAMFGAIAPFGFQWFAIAKIPEPSRGQLELRVTAWPPGWHNRYLDENYYAVDPIASHARHTSEPFFWSEVQWHPGIDMRAGAMMADAAAHGLSHGLSVPILAASGEQEVVSMACGSPALVPGDRHALQLISVYAHHRACELAGGTRRSARLPGPRATQ